MPPLCVCLCVGLRDVVLHSGEMRAAVPFHVRFASSTHSLFSLTLPHRMPYRNCPGDAGRIDSRRLPIRCVLLQLSHQLNSRNAKMFVMKTDDVRCVAISTPFHRFYLQHNMKMCVNVCNMDVSPPFIIFLPSKIFRRCTQYDDMGSGAPGVNDKKCKTCWQADLYHSGRLPLPAIPLSFALQ